MYSKKAILAKTLLAKLQNTSEEAYIFIHKSMDGDCIGSSVGLCEVIRNLGFKASVISGEKIQDCMGFLKIENHVKLVLDKAEYENITTDLVIAVDCAEASRMGDVGSIFDTSENRITIDHHHVSVENSDSNFIVPEASSASELAFMVSKELAKLCGREINEVVTPFAAQLFLTGIITDTGRFSYSNTRPETLVTASELMELGGSISSSMFWFYDWKTKEELLVSSAATALARFDCDGKIASVVVKEELFEKYNAKVDQIGEVVARLRDVDGVYAAFVLRELGDGKVRVNLRSHEPFDCLALASQFGGGGHLRAAGCTVEGDIDEVREEIVKKAIELLK